MARELLAGTDVRPAAVCVSGIGPCVLVTDEEGRPLRPAILYGVDTRATAEIADLTARLGADAILARCGSPLTTQAVGPKLLWLSRHEPEIWAASRRMFMASSYAVWRLTGEYVLDHHSASQCDPMYSLSEERSRRRPGVDWQNLRDRLAPLRMRWDLAVLANLASSDRPVGPADLIRAINAQSTAGYITWKALADRLRRLEAAGYVARQEVLHVPRETRYWLLPADAA